MKKFIGFITLAALVPMFAVLLAGCEKEGGNGEEPQPLTFEFAIEGFEITITPSDPEATYFFDCDPLKWFDPQYGYPAEYDDAEAFIAAYEADYSGYVIEEHLHTGVHTFIKDVDKSRYNDDYLLFAVGYADGAITSELFAEVFKFQTAAVEDLPMTSLTGDFAHVIESGTGHGSWSVYEDWDAFYDDVWLLNIEDEFYNEEGSSLQVAIRKDGDSFAGEHKIANLYYVNPGNAVQGYTEDNDKSVIKGTWYYCTENAARRAAAVSGDVSIADLGGDRYKVEAEFRDEKNNTVRFTYTGYILPADAE